MSLLPSPAAEPSAPAASAIEGYDDVSSTLILRSGWRRADPVIAADAKTFWSRLNLLSEGADVDARAGEIVTAAYAGGLVVGVSTAVPRDVPLLRCRMAVFRLAVGPRFARPEVFARMVKETRGILEAWSLENPDEGVMGVLTFGASESAVEKLAPARKDTGLSLAGFTENGQRIMLAWFEHARV